MINPVADRLYKFLLTLVSLIVLLHSISLYTLPVSDLADQESAEMTQDDDRQGFQLQAYEALIPAVQGMAPLVLYFLSEVVLLNESEYQEMPSKVSYENRYLEVLFPLIISPNAP